MLSEGWLQTKAEKYVAISFMVTHDSFMVGPGKIEPRRLVGRGGIRSFPRKGKSQLAWKDSSNDEIWAGDWEVASASSLCLGEHH